MALIWFPWLAAGLLLIDQKGSVGTEETQKKQTQKAWDLLQTHCSTCHGRNGKARGGFDYILDRNRLLSRGQIIPGKAIDSPLWQRIDQNEMPPARSHIPPLGPEDRKLLERWINQGAAGLSSIPLTALTPQEQIERIQADLEALEPRQRRYQRYFTLGHLVASGATREELDLHRQALSKLANSLSWNPRILVPTPIDPAQTIYRMDLRDYQWNARIWDRLTAIYPFKPRIAPKGDSRLSRMTESETPVVHGDWWIATASSPPFYHEFLQLPTSDRALERLLRIDVQANLQEDTALRTGFNGSGVARSNRILERHDAGYGAYWRSYDFRDTGGRSNIFEHPLGPGAGNNSFQHAGGEIIFHLPNGLLAFLLVDAAGNRIDHAPTEIVSDPKRPDRLVTNGISCFSCHVKGFIVKDDQVLPQLEKTWQRFSESDRGTLKALYGRQQRLKAFLQEDNRRLKRALLAAGVSDGEPEPIERVTLSHEAIVDQSRAAAEIDLPVETLLQRIQEQPRTLRALSPLLTRAGTVQRQLFEEFAPELLKPSLLAKELPRRENLAGSLSGGIAPRVLCPDPNSENVALGSEDGLIRIVNRQGKEILRLTGHRDEITVLAYAGKNRLLSGGRDRTIRFWDLQSGQERFRLQGHTDSIRSLAVAVDGKLAISGGADRTIRLWDLDQGVERGVWTGHKGPVTSLTISPSGQWALSGSQDRTVRLWNMANGQEKGQWQGHQDTVYAVAFAPDEKTAASGGGDRNILIWDVSTGKIQRRLEGHRNSVVALAYATEGARLLSGSSQFTLADRVVRIWDLNLGKEIAGVDATSEERISTLSFSSDRNEAIWIDPERGIQRRVILSIRKTP